MLHTGQCHFEHNAECMNPFTSLTLTHAEQKSNHFLKWIGLEVEENEQQFAFHRVEYRFATSARFTLPFFVLAVPLFNILSPGYPKRSEQLFEFCRI